MIWIKRVLPFLIIAILYYGYNFYQKQQSENKIAKEKKYALVTAQAWIGSMKHHEDPEAYIAFRDSLLDANNLSNDSLKMFIESYKSESENLVPIASYIKLNVDSILHYEDSLKQLTDSLALADSLAEKI